MPDEPKDPATSLQGIKRLPEEAVGEAFKSVFPPQEIHETLPTTGKTVVIQLQGQIAAAETARVVASNLRMANGAMIRRAISSEFTPSVERSSRPGKTSTDVDREILAALEEGAKILPTEVLGEPLDMRLTVESQTQVLANLQARIDAGDVDHVVLAREIQEGEQRTLRVLKEFSFEPAVKDPSVFQSWYDRNEQLRAALVKVTQGIELSQEDMTAIKDALRPSSEEDPTGGLLEVLQKANLAKINAGKKLVVSLERAGFIVPREEEGPGRVASVILHAQLPAELNVTRELVEEIREYTRALGVHAAYVDQLIRVGQRFERADQKFVQRLREYTEVLQQVAAELPATSTGG